MNFPWKTIVVLSALLVVTGCSDSEDLSKVDSDSIMQSTPVNQRVASFESRVEIANAINSNDLEAAQRWITNGGDPNEYAPTDHVTPMHIAASLHRSAILELFLQHGGNPNVVDFGSNSPLHYAASNFIAMSDDDEKVKTLKVLIDHGADPTMISGEGDTAAELAVFNNDDQISADFLNNAAKKRAAMESVESTIIDIQLRSSPNPALEEPNE